MKDSSVNSKKLVLAASWIDFMFYLAANNLSRSDCTYVVNRGQMLGLPITTPVVILEHYYLNASYSLWDMVWLGRLFTDITFVTEAEMHDKQAKIHLTIH